MLLLLGCLSAPLARAEQSGDFTYSSDGSVITITGYTGASGAVEIPATIAGLPVRTLGVDAFRYKFSLTSVVIPDSVTSIGEGAFWQCSGLTSVSIPDSVITIGADAFPHCTSLTSVIIGKSVVSIGEGAFRSCSTLTSVAIPDSVTSIGDFAFVDCPKLASVNLGHGVTSIGASAFGLCTGLTSVSIPASVTSIGREAFSDCTNLASATFEGNAPATFGLNVFRYSASGFKIYYYQGSTGFTPVWNGYPTVAIPRPSTPETPPEIISSVTREPGKFMLGVSGKAGATYQLQRRADLTSGEWQTIATVGPVAADGPFDLQDLQAPVDQAFYRIVVTGP